MRTSKLHLNSPLRFTVVLAGLTLAFANLSPALAGADGGQSARASKASCAGADRPTTDMRRFRRAIRCLHNLERRRHGLRSLRWNRDLSKAAAKHSRDMVRRHYFDHLSPSRKNHMDRIAAGGYRPSAGRWSAGENLFFSRGRTTPRQIMRAWMNSKAHRENILMGRWHDFGLGVVETSPYGDAGGLTIVALFGNR